MRLGGKAYVQYYGQGIGYQLMQAGLSQLKEYPQVAVWVLKENKRAIHLLDAFVRARELACTRMNIGIVEENQILRKWYERYGFIHTGEKKYDFFPFTCGYMTRDLTAVF